MSVENPFRYVRDRRGRTIHRSYCRCVGPNHVPWNLADDMTADDICRVVWPSSWLHPCLICKPDTYDYAEACRSMDERQAGAEGCLGCFRCRAGDHGTCHGCPCRCPSYDSTSCPESCADGGIYRSRILASAS